MGLPQRATPIGTVQRPWKRLINRATGNCTNNSGTFDASTYNHKITLPATVFASGIFVVSPDVCNQIILSFWGAAAASTFIAHVYAITECDAPGIPPTPPAVAHGSPTPYTEYRGSHIGTLTPTLGTGAIESGSLIYPASTVFAESIAKTVDSIYSGWSVFANESTGTAMVAGDFTGGQRLLFALKTGGSATGMGFDWREA